MSISFTRTSAPTVAFACSRSAFWNSGVSSFGRGGRRSPGREGDEQDEGRDAERILFMRALLTASRRRRASARRAGPAAPRCGVRPSRPTRRTQAVLTPELGAERLEDAARAHHGRDDSKRPPVDCARPERMRSWSPAPTIVRFAASRGTASPDERARAAGLRPRGTSRRGRARRLAHLRHHVAGRQRWCGRPRRRTPRRAPADVPTRDRANRRRPPACRGARSAPEPKPWATLFSTSGRSPFSSPIFRA